MKAIYWLRNDLRIHDNATLNLFCEQAAQGLVVWCASASFHRAGELRQSFVLHSLEEISVRLKTKGLPVIRSFNQAREIVPKLAQQYSIDKIFVSAEGTPEEKAEENDVAAGWNGNLQRVEQASLLHGSGHEEPGEHAAANCRHDEDEKCRYGSELCAGVTDACKQDAECCYCEGCAQSHDHKARNVVPEV